MTFCQAMLGGLLCFTATVLLSVVSIKSDAISFLDVTTGKQAIHFGVFGHSGTDMAVGYTFNLPNIVDGAPVQANALTKVLIIHPFAAVLSGLACVIGLIAARCHRSGIVWMSALSALAMLITLVAWAVDMAAFSMARSHFINKGLVANFGIAIWLTLGALLALIVAFIIAFRIKRKKRETSVNVQVSVKA